MPEIQEDKIKFVPVEEVPFKDLPSNLTEDKIRYEQVRPDVSGLPESMKKASWVEDVLTGENIGGTIGGVAGSVIGSGAPGVGTIAGGMAGAALGGSLGAATEDLIKYAASTFAPELNVNNLPFSTEEETEDYIKKYGLAATRQAAYDFAGGMIAKGTFAVARPVFKWVFGKIHPEVATVLRVLPMLNKGKTMPIMAHEATQGTLLDIASNVVEGSMLGQSRVIDWFKPMREKVVNDMLDAMVDQLGRYATPEQIGNFITETVWGRITARTAATKPLWDDIARLMKDELIDIRRLKKIGIIKQYTHAIEELGTGKLSEDMVKIVNSINSLPDYASWNAADALRKDVARQIREATFKLGKQDILAKGLGDTQTELYKASRRAADRAGHLYEWNLARRTTAKMSVEIDQKFVKGLFDRIRRLDNPDIAVNQIFSRNGRANLVAIKKLLGPDSDEVKSLGVYYLKTVLSDPKVRSPEGLLNGKAFYNNIFGKGQYAYGEEFLKELLKPDQLSNLHDVAKTLDFLSREQGIGTGKVWIQLQQASSVGAFFGLAFGGPTIKTGSAAILFGPLLLSRLLTSKRFTNALIHGIGKPKYSKDAISAMLRITDIVNEERIEMVKQMMIDESERRKKEASNIFMRNMQNR